MENVSTPVKGLIKTYRKPFSVWSDDNPDAHEALDENDLSLAKFTKELNIVLLNQ